MANLETVTRSGANFDESGEFWCTFRPAVFVRSWIVGIHLELFRCLSAVELRWLEDVILGRGCIVIAIPGRRTMWEVP